MIELPSGEFNSTNLAVNSITDDLFFNFTSSLPEICYHPIPELPNAYILYHYSIILAFGFYFITIYGLASTSILIRYNQGIPVNHNALHLLASMISLLVAFSWSLNPVGFRLGVPFTSMSTSLGPIAFTMYSVSRVIQTHSVRQSSLHIDKNTELGSVEEWCYTVLGGLQVLLGFIFTIILILADIGFIYVYWFERISYGLSILTGFLCTAFSITGLIIWIRLYLKNKAAAHAVKKYVPDGIFTLCFGSLCLYSTYVQELNEEETYTCMNDLNSRQSTDQLSNYMICLLIIATVGFIQAFRELPKLLEGADTTQILHSVSLYDLYIKRGTVALFLFTWIWIPYVGDFNTLYISYSVFLFVIPAAGCIHFYNSSNVSEKYLAQCTITRDLLYQKTMASLGKYRTAIYYFGSWFGDTFFRYLSLITILIMNFHESHSSINPEMFYAQKINDTLRVSNTKTKFLLFAPIILLMYLGDSSCRLFYFILPYEYKLYMSKYINGWCTWSFKKWSQYLHSSLSILSIWILLQSLQCDDGKLLFHKFAECNGRGWHLFHMVLTYNVITWCIVLGSLSHVYEISCLLSADQPSVKYHLHRYLGVTFCELYIVVLEHFIPSKKFYTAPMLLGLLLIFHFFYPITIGSSVTDGTIHAFLVLTFIMSCSVFSSQLFVAFSVLTIILWIGIFIIGQKTASIPNIGTSKRLTKLYSILKECEKNNETIFSKMDEENVGIFFYFSSFQRYIWDLMQKEEDVKFCSETSLVEIPENLESSQMPDLKSDCFGRGNPGLRAVKLACASTFGEDAVRQLEGIGECLLKFLSLDASPFDQLHASKIFKKIYHHIPEATRWECFDAIVHLWTFSKNSRIHSQCAEIIKMIRGNDRMIAYAGSENLSLTPLHDAISRKSTENIIKLQIVNRCVWLVPIYQDRENEIPFTADDPIDCILSFPPKLLISSRICKRFPKASRLLIPYIHRNTSVFGLGCRCILNERPTMKSSTTQNLEENKYRHDEDTNGKSFFDYFLKHKKKYEHIPEIKLESQSKSSSSQERTDDANVHLKMYILFIIYHESSHMRDDHDMDYLLQIRHALTNFFEGFLKKNKIL